ncbi:hypothetical protein B0T26DRAFT_603361, partial [Lasiosphaeria miniovina]
ACSHSGMTRLYTDAVECPRCGRPCDMGYLLRCVMDRDAIIMNAKEKGFPVSFDEVGETFEDQMSLGKHGADARSDRYSVLREMTAEQLHTYTPEQLITVMQQRESVHAAITKDRSNVSGAARRKFPDDAKPWVPDSRYECQFKACLGCFRQGIDKSKTGIDAIVEGDISPGLATGFAFSQLGERPVMDARVVANLG